MQLNKSCFIDKSDQSNLGYLETDFEHYPMYPKAKVSTSIYKTQDGRRSRDNLKMKEKNRLMQFRQNSTKELSNTLKRVRSKRLTQRGNKRISDLNSSGESYKYFSNLNATQNKFKLDGSF